MATNDPTSLRLMSADIQVPTIDQAQVSLLRDEAIAHWTARNRIREALVTKIGELILKLQPGDEDKVLQLTTQLLEKLETLSKNDPITEQILGKLV